MASSSSAVNVSVILTEDDIPGASLAGRNPSSLKNEELRLWLRCRVVSFAAVIRVVTQCSSPTNGCSLELYIPFLKLTNKDQASISWKPGPLAANVTRNMIGAAANSYMHVVGSP